MSMRLYDLCGENDLRFSPYCARAKLALAIKGLSFETLPTPFTRIKTIGDGTFKTVPVLDDQGVLIGDSFAIADYLDKTYPERPGLFAPGEAGRASARFVEGVMNFIVQMAITPLMALDILNQLQREDKAYFRTSREQRFGDTLEALQRAREAKIGGVQKLLTPLAHTLKDRPFLGGERPLFVDAIPFGSIHWTRAIGSFDLLGDDPVLNDWYARCRALLDSADRPS